MKIYRVSHENGSWSQRGEPGRNKNGVQCGAVISTWHGGARGSERLKAEVTKISRLKWLALSVSSFPTYETGVIGFILEQAALYHFMWRCVYCILSTIRLPDQLASPTATAIFVFLNGAEF
jgi:hypothetical protein